MRSSAMEGSSFGLRSAPKVFNAVADVLEWHVIRLGVNLIYHYLDNFIVLGPPGSSKCQRDLQLLEVECHKLELPLAKPRHVVPTTCLVFLGIEIDTLARSLMLPEEKLQRLIQTLNEWGDKKVCTHRQLESFIGLLNHACKVVFPGRTFYGE